MIDELIAHHGGKLVLNLAGEQEQGDLRERAQSPPQVEVGSRQLSDLEMLAIFCRACDSMASSKAIRMATSSMSRSVARTGLRRVDRHPVGQENIASILVNTKSKPVIPWPGLVITWDVSRAVAEAYAAASR